VELGATRQAVTYKDHDYLFVTTPKTWQEAQAYCKLSGYHLVTVDDWEEEYFLDEQETYHNLNNWWLGYSDHGLESSWLWSYGWSSYTNWFYNQPDNGGTAGEHCAADRHEHDNSSWHDADCNNAYPFICEREEVLQHHRGKFEYTAWDTNNATWRTRQHSVYVYAGQLLTVGTCGLQDATYEGDTVLRVYSPGGQEIAWNDNSGGECGFGSNISVIAPMTGAYVIRAGCKGSSKCGGTVVYNY